MRYILLLTFLLHTAETLGVVEGGRDLETLLSYAKQIQSHAVSVYQSSTAKLISLEPSRPLDGGASLQFWGESLTKYRYQSRMNHAQGEADFDITYDGNQYSWYNPKSQLMTLSTNDSASLMTSLNPLLLPSEFLSRRSDSCMGCQLKLSDFVDSNVLRQRIHLLSIHKNDDATEFVLSGNIKDGIKFNWKVVFDGTNKVIPKFIRKETLGGDFIDEFQFPKIENVMLDGNLTMWPRTVEYIGVDPKSKRRFKLLYDVMELKFGLKIKPEIFLPDTNAAQIILDGDVDGRVIKKQSKKVARVNVRVAILLSLLLLSLLPLACIWYFLSKGKLRML